MADDIIDAVLQAEIKQLARKKERLNAEIEEGVLRRQEIIATRDKINAKLLELRTARDARNAAKVGP